MWRFVWIALVACSGSSPKGPDSPGGDAPDDGAPSDGFITLDPTPGTYRETCDGSGAIAIDAEHFLDVNDEDQGARIYKRASAAAPVQQMDLSAALGLATTAEADLEDVARIGDRLYVITSHGRNNDGELEPARYRFGAIDLAGAVPSLAMTPAGSSQRVLSDLLVAASWDTPNAAVIAALTTSSKLNDPTDADLAPELAGTNIEGLASDNAGHLWIGFRNPRPGGPAIAISLTNPAAVVAGQPAHFGSAALLELGGLGIRSMAWSAAHGAILVLAGPHTSGGPFRLYRWSGTGAPQLVRDVTAPASSAPEAIVPYPGTRDVQVLFDQGDADINGDRCKDAPSAARRFTDVILTVGP